MNEVRKNQNESKDYKERFEFRLTFGSNIICQRYFRISDFNPMSLKSYELMDVVRQCGSIINDDLKSKSRIYMAMMSPKIFKDKEEMDKYFSNSDNRRKMSLGEGIVLKDNPNKNFYWGNDEKAEELDTVFSDGEFVNDLTEEDRVNYKFSFIDNGREVASTVWEGVYPKQIRKSIDLSNKIPFIENDRDVYTLGFEQYLKYKLNNGRNDLVYRIIKDICAVCSGNENKWYTTSMEFKKDNGKVVTYKNDVYYKRIYNFINRTYGKSGK